MAITEMRRFIYIHTVPLIWARKLGYTLSLTAENSAQSQGAWAETEAEAESGFQIPDVRIADGEGELRHASDSRTGGVDGGGHQPGARRQETGARWLVAGGGLVRSLTDTELTGREATVPAVRISCLMHIVCVAPDRNPDPESYSCRKERSMRRGRGSTGRGHDGGAFVFPVLKTNFKRGAINI